MSVHVHAVDPTNRMYCADCNEWIIPVDGVTAIYDRGYWWCAKHVDMAYWKDGKPVVSFPSRGQLSPRTIMMQDDNTQQEQG